MHSEIIRPPRALWVPFILGRPLGKPGDEAFQLAVVRGVTPHHWSFGAMPPIAGLGREEVASIVAFVRSEQEAAGIFQDPSDP